MDSKERPPLLPGGSTRDDFRPGQEPAIWRTLDPLQQQHAKMVAQGYTQSDIAQKKSWKLRTVQERELKIADELDAQRTSARGRKDVDQAAATGYVSRLFDERGRPVPDAEERCDETIGRVEFACLDIDCGRLRLRRERSLGQRYRRSHDDRGPARA